MRGGDEKTFSPYSGVLVRFDKVVNSICMLPAAASEVVYPPNNGTFFRFPLDVDLG